MDSARPNGIFTQLHTSLPPSTPNFINVIQLLKRCTWKATSSQNVHWHLSLRIATCHRLATRHLAHTRPRYTNMQQMAWAAIGRSS